MKVQARIITAHSCAASLKVLDNFPNLYILLEIATTLPVISCECERSISTMRRLNNYMRCTMGESRLSPLAIMHIKYEQSGVGNWGAYAFVPRYLAAPVEFCKTFRVLSRYVSLTMNVPSKTEILLL